MELTSLHFTIIGTNSALMNTLNCESKAVVFSVQGLASISYPLIGLLADVKLIRYQVMCLSCWILLVAHLLLSLIDFCFILTSDELYSNSSVFTTSIIFYLAITVFAIVGKVGKGMFESTCSDSIWY